MKGYKPIFNMTRLDIETACTNCGKKLDATTSVDHREIPKPGAIGICLVCCHIMVYDETLHLRDLNDQEMLDVAGNPEIIRLVNALGSAKEDFEKKNPGQKWGQPNAKKETAETK
jgi:hypothetical protein